MIYLLTLRAHTLRRLASTGVAPHTLAASFGLPAHQVLRIIGGQLR